MYKIAHHRLGVVLTGPSTRRREEPFTIGIPLAPGIVTGSTRGNAQHADGSSAPVQISVLDRWPDGSARWMLADFQANVDQRATVSIELAPDTESSNARPLASMSGPRVVVDTGAAEFQLGPAHFPFERATRGGASVFDPLESILSVTSASGAVHRPVIARVEIEDNGPIRAVVRIDASLRVDGAPLELIARLHFFAGKAVVKFDVTLRNPRRARHDGGFWELGDRGSLLLRDVSMRFSLPPAGTAAVVRASEAVDAPLREYSAPFELHQESSGGELWQSPVHRNRDGNVPFSFRGYKVTSASRQHEGLRATPIVQVSSDGRTLSIAMRQFWENFPKAISARDGSLTLHLFPGQHAALHELQGGEQKTHTFWLGLGDDDVADVPFDWCRTPSHAAVDPEWVAATGAMPFLTPKADDSNHDYLALVDSAISGGDSFFHKREVVDEYGWRHFGEVWADHEAVFEKEQLPLVSHYNNQYDAVAGCAYQFLRSGDARWWTLMDDLARHVVDIDIYHTDDDWPKYNHGLFWHTVHYQDAGRSTHRTYPRAKGVYGGGPSAGHLYTTGLMVHYFMTGSRASREAAIGLGQFVIDADDGAQSVFKWIDRGRTGHVSASVDAGYHGPGRAPANALNAVIDAHRLTGDARFLSKADELVRRCIHPNDDIEARQLLDAERRWFYTMFLQSLGKLLVHKHELGQIDALYAYGRASLLTYARWMLAHEYPYLDRPEILEYPTETWAAQDMRKSEVFKWAILHADGIERDQFMDRSRFFFDYSTRTLTSMPTRTLARPVILLLAYGWSHAAYAQAMPAMLPGPLDTSDFGTPAEFESQKPRAIRRAKMIVVGCIGIAAFATIAAAIAWWIP